MTATAYGGCGRPVMYSIDAASVGHYGAVHEYGDSVDGDDVWFAPLCGSICNLSSSNRESSTLCRRHNLPSPKGKVPVKQAEGRVWVKGSMKSEKRHCVRLTFLCKTFLH